MEGKEKLKKILTEWAEFETPKLYPRQFTQTLLEGSEILSIIGARRTGKTYLCYQIIQELRKTTPKDNTIYINFEDERLYPLKGNELTLLWDTCLELFLVDLQKRVYLFVDEIQNVKNWSRWARRITEQQRNLKLIITSSSSKLLSQEIATELRGRTLSFTVYPLSFSEYVKAKNIDIEDRNLLYSPKHLIIKRHFNEYVKSGGFPATLETSHPAALLKEYYKVMFYRDVIERYKIKNIKLFEDYLTLLIDQVGLSFSISSTAGKLNEFGHTFSKNTLSNFLRYLQEAFIIFETKIYRYKIKEQLRAHKKLYAIDHGLVQAVRFSFSENYGRMLENIVYISLKRKGYEVYYYKGRRECDFIAVDNNKIGAILQVTKSLSAAETKRREIDGLTEALSQYKLKNGLILTEDESDTLKIGRLTIRIAPMWYWLLF